MPFPKVSRGVDSHAHVFSATASPVDGARYRPAYAARLEEWRALRAAAGITHGVVVQVSFFGTDNRELLEAVARDPVHLRGVAIVDAQASPAHLASLHAGGVRAARLNLSGATDFAAYGSAAWRAFLERIASLGWHLEAFADAGRFPQLAAALAPVPVPLVLDHFGNPGHDAEARERTFDAVAALAARRPVWCKLSAPYRLGGADPVPLAARWLEIVGPGRLVWGSDWPWTRHEAGRDYAGSLAALERWVPADIAAAVLWDNPARLYRFD